MIGIMDDQGNELQVEFVDGNLNPVYRAPNKHLHRTEAAELVYESLPVLVEGMIKLVPDLKVCLRPLIKASKVS